MSIIKIKVRPNSKEDKIVKISEYKYSASVKQPPEDNKANNNLIKLLSKEFNTSHKNIKIKNPSSRNKIIEIKNEIRIRLWFKTSDNGNYAIIEYDSYKIRKSWMSKKLRLLFKENNSKVPCIRKANAKSNADKSILCNRILRKVW